MLLAHVDAVSREPAVCGLALKEKRWLVVTRVAGCSRSGVGVNLADGSGHTIPQRSNGPIPCISAVQMRRYRISIGAQQDLGLGGG